MARQMIVSWTNFLKNIKKERRWYYQFLNSEERKEVAVFHITSQLPICKINKKTESVLERH